jgi:2-hydroxy-3-keto-5-methylthiopentenyl-1-phosphate phosphatase
MNFPIAIDFDGTIVEHDYPEILDKFSKTLC